MASITQIEQQVNALALAMGRDVHQLRQDVAALGGGGGSPGSTTIDWANITNKPTTFAPAAHTQTASTISDFNTAVDARIALISLPSADWNTLLNKPATFAPSTHTHVAADITNFNTSVDARIALAGAGTGNVFGPATSVVGNLALWNNTGGTLLKDGGGGVSANGLTLIGQTFANMKTSLGLVVGTDVQAYSAKLGSLAALTWAADKLPYFTGTGTVATTDISAFVRTLLDDADAAAFRATLGNIEPFTVALSDENTTLTTGTAKVTFRAPYPAILVAHPVSGPAVRLSLKEAHTAGLFTVDANINGASMLSTKLTIDANEKTSKTAATAAVLSTSSWDDDDEITIDITSIGTAGTPKGAKMTFFLRRA